VERPKKRTAQSLHFFLRGTRLWQTKPPDVATPPVDIDGYSKPDLAQKSSVSKVHKKVHHLAHKIDPFDSFRFSQGTL
jgi:hypothetical protein